MISGLSLCITPMHPPDWTLAINYTAYLLVCQARLDVNKLRFEVKEGGCLRELIQYFELIFGPGISKN